MLTYQGILPMGVKQLILKGTFYIAIARYSGLVVGLIITSILARILTPEDYGVVAIAMVFITLFSLLSDMGIGSAIIQYKDLSKEDVSSIFGLSFWIGILLALLFFLSSYPISKFYDNQQLVTVCQILSIQVLFVAFDMVPNSLLLKEQKFKIIAFRTLSIQICCGILAIWAAYNGWKLYSLLIAPVFGAIISFLVNTLYSNLKLTLFPQKHVVKKIASFSTFQFLFGIINYFGNNLHSILIGKVIGMNALGYYEKGNRLIALPVQNINGVLAPVLHPILSNYQNNNEFIFCTLQKMVNILIVISIPFSILFCVAAKDIVLILFGYQWMAAVPCVQILSFTIVLRMASVSLGAILQTLNRTSLLFKIGTINVLVAIMSLIVSSSISNTIESICIGVLVSSVISFLFTFYSLFHIAFNKSFIKNMSVFVKPTLLYILLLTVSFTLMIYIDSNSYINLIWKAGVSCVFTLLYVHFFTEYNLSHIFKKR